MLNKAKYVLLASVLAWGFSLVPALAAGHAVGSNIIAPDGTVYTITTQNGQTVRAPYTSSGAFLSYSFNTWDSISGASAEDLALPVGSFIPPQNGKIICSNKGSDTGTCYLITNGQKAAFTSANVFTGLGYSFSNAMSGDVSFLPSAANINSATVPHDPGTLINKDGTIYLVGSNGLIGLPSWSTLQSWGYTSADIVPANSADDNLTVVGTLSARQPQYLTPATSTCPNNADCAPAPTSPTPTPVTTSSGNTIQITTTNGYLPTGSVGAAYSATVYFVNNDTYGVNATWTGLPSGIIGQGFASDPNHVLDILGNGQVQTGLSGIPTQQGTYSVTLTLTDTGTNFTVSKTFTLVVGSASALSITGNSLPTATVGQSYSASIPYSYNGNLALNATWTGLPSGVIGQGLASDPDHVYGIIGNTNQYVLLSGTPTQSGTYTVTLQMTDQGSNNASQTFTLTVNPAPSSSTSPTVYISDLNMTNGVAGQSYSMQFHATGGTAPYTWSNYSSTNPCCNVGINPTTGVFGSVAGSGTAPPVAGTWQIGIKVTDANGQSYSRIYTWTVTASVSTQSAATTPTISGPSTAQVGVPANYTITSTDQNNSGYNGGSLSYSISWGDGSAAYYTSDFASGVADMATHTWTALGTYTISVTVTPGSGGTASAAYQVTVN